MKRNNLRLCIRTAYHLKDHNLPAVEDLGGSFKTMRIALLISILYLLVIHVAVAEDPIDTAVTIRNTVLRSEPVQTSDVVAELVVDTDVLVYERQRLWVRLASVNDADTAGWLRFTELRFGTTTAAKNAAPRSSGFAGFSRSVSGFLGSFRGGGSRATQKTSTIGIRGLTVAELETARPDAKALAAISRYAMSSSDAEQFAGSGGLTARSVPYGGNK